MPLKPSTRSDEATKIHDMIYHQLNGIASISKKKSELATLLEKTPGAFLETSKNGFTHLHDIVNWMPIKTHEEITLKIINRILTAFNTLLSTVKTNKEVYRFLLLSLRENYSCLDLVTSKNYVKVAIAYLEEIKTAHKDKIISDDEYTNILLSRALPPNQPTVLQKSTFLSFEFLTKYGEALDQCLKLEFISTEEYKKYLLRIVDSKLHLFFLKSASYNSPITIWKLERAKELLTNEEMLILLSEASNKEKDNFFHQLGLKNKDIITQGIEILKSTFTKNEALLLPLLLQKNNEGLTPAEKAKKYNRDHGATVHDYFLGLEEELSRLEQHDQPLAITQVESILPKVETLKAPTTSSAMILGKLNTTLPSAQPLSSLTKTAEPIKTTPQAANNIIEVTSKTTSKLDKDTIIFFKTVAVATACAVAGVTALTYI